MFPSMTSNRGAVLLRRWRERQVPKVTQHAAASLFGLWGTQVSVYERGIHRPSEDTARRIERLTGGAVPAGSWAQEQSPVRAARRRRAAG